MPKLDPAETRAWLSRWNEVEEVTLAELRRMTPEEKLAQLETLMRDAAMFDWSAADEEDARVRELWMRLRERYGC